MEAARRQLVHQILWAALDAVEPGSAVRRALRFEGGEILLGERRYPAAAFRRAVIVGAGKASAPMAAAAEQVLMAAGLPVEGAVVVRYGHAAPTTHVRILEASHPLPDEAGVAAAHAILALLQGCGEADLVVCVLSGGGSALLTLPAEGLTLADLQATTGALLRSGATIQQVNSVRKHLDQVKGGGLARAAAPATLLTLVLSDVVGNPLDAIASGPTVPDGSTWADAAASFDLFGLWESAPAAVAQRLRLGLAGAIAETPKPGEPVFARARARVVGSSLLACRAAATEAERLGFRGLVLTTFLEGEARDAGRTLASFLREVDASGHPVPRPCCLVAGGETTVRVRGGGKGGRNQELALAAAWALDGVPEVLFASIGTDGSDGPTDAAGAMVDGGTLARARACGLEPEQALRENDAYPFFEALGDLVRTGPTRTNVNDLYLLFAF